MYTLEVAEIAKTRDIAANKDILQVSVKLRSTKKGEHLVERVLAFSVDIEQKDLEVELKKYLDTFNSDVSARAQEVEREEEQLKVDKNLASIKEDLEGATIK